VRFGSDGAFRIGFVTGATPDKWSGVWRERYPRDPLDLVPVTEDDQETLLRSRELDMALVRLPIDRDGMHIIRLYDEVPVVVASREHFIAAADEVSVEDLADEQLVRPHRTGWRPAADQLAWPAMTEREAIETVAAGTGVVVVPMSVARLYHRKDVVHRPVTDIEPTSIALAWLVERDDERAQRFVGVVRGRSARSSR
jgi:DNA-binding transcriptional LysR family regulator